MPLAVTPTYPRVIVTPDGVRVLTAGVQGPQGPTGPTGATGPQGPTGPTGATGPAGSQILFGAGAPASGLGVDGDFYENTSNGDVYKKITGTWTLQDNLTGPQGATGAQGPQGIQGVQGIQGPQGATGPAGPGVPVGGAAGQVLKKVSAADFDSVWDTLTLASADFANQGTTTTVLHGNAAGNPAFGAVVEADQTLADNTTNDVSTTKHGYAPKAPNDATKFLDGTGAYDTVKDSDLATTDITTGDVSITKHGFAPKAPNDATKFLNGAGAWAVPAGAAGAELWDVVATLAADFTVTNALLQDVTGFTGAITSGQSYEVEVIGAASANDTGGDIAVALAATGTWTVLGAWFEGVIHVISGGTVGSPVAQGVTAFASTTLSTASPGLPIDNGDGASRPFRLSYFFTCSGNGNAKFQMGNNSAGPGRTSTLKAGTTFRLRRVG